MAWVNKIFALGKVKNITFGQTTSGVRVANFTLEVNEKAKGEDKIETFDCALYGRAVDSFESYVKEDSKVMIEGKQRTKNGIKGLMVDSIQYL